MRATLRAAAAPRYNMILRRRQMRSARARRLALMPRCARRYHADRVAPRSMLRATFAAAAARCRVVYVFVRCCRFADFLDFRHAASFADDISPPITPLSIISDISFFRH
jgi:hypothetical protein